MRSLSKEVVTPPPYGTSLRKFYALTNMVQTVYLEQISENTCYFPNDTS